MVDGAFDGAGQLQSSVGNSTGDDSYVFDAFRAARPADPDAKLFDDDFGAEDVDAKSDAVLALALRLRTQTVAVEIDGLGLQMHVGTAPDPALVVASIERPGQAGLLGRIMEMDVPLPPDDEGQPSDVDSGRQRESDNRLVAAYLDATNCDDGGVG